MWERTQVAGVYIPTRVLVVSLELEQEGGLLEGDTQRVYLCVT